jgi:hypothetical protein
MVGADGPEAFWYFAAVVARCAGPLANVGDRTDGRSTACFDARLHYGQPARPSQGQFRTVSQVLFRRFF